MAPVTERAISKAVRNALAGPGSSRALAASCLHSTRQGPVCVLHELQGVGETAPRLCQAQRVRERTPAEPGLWGVPTRDQGASGLGDGDVRAGLGG